MGEDSALARGEGTSAGWRAQGRLRVQGSPGHTSKYVHPRPHCLTLSFLPPAVVHSVSPGATFILSHLYNQILKLHISTACQWPRTRGNSDRRLLWGPLVS